MGRKIEDVAADMIRTFQGVSVGLCFLDMDLRYVDLNERLAGLNGVDLQDHLGHHLGYVLPGIAAAGAERELLGVLESGRSVTKGVVTSITPASSEQRTFMHNYHAIRGRKDRIIGVSCCVVDVTELRAAEQERT